MALMRRGMLSKNIICWRGDKLGIGWDCAVFMQINSAKYTDDEKAMAIYHVLGMPTHNGITKAAMLNVIGWLFDKHYDVEDAQ